MASPTSIVCLESFRCGINLGLDQAARKRRAYALIRELAELVNVDNCGPWEAAKRVHDLTERFEANVWRRLRVMPVPLCLPSDVLLAQLFMLRITFPKSQGGIYEQVLKHS
jgi:hypothetical protein